MNNENKYKNDNNEKKIKYICNKLGNHNVLLFIDQFNKLATLPPNHIFEKELSDEYWNTIISACNINSHIDVIIDGILFIIHKKILEYDVEHVGTCLEKYEIMTLLGEIYTGLILLLENKDNKDYSELRLLFILNSQLEKIKMPLNPNAKEYVPIKK